jgi:hypothetical protein
MACLAGVSPKSAVSLHGLASGWENQALYLRAEAFVFGSFAALLLAISAAHAAGRYGRERPM